MRKLRNSISPILLVAILALAIAIGSWSFQLSRQNRDAGSEPPSGDVATVPDGVPEEFNKVFEVWNTLKREHFQGNSLDAGELSDGAIRGMLESLNDPYASYLTAHQYSMDSQDFKGFFEGIGAEVAMRDGRITIVAPIPDTPADRAGVLPGDIILQIDGESTDGISLMEAVSLIRGPKGEPVDLLILHQSGGDPVSVRILRDVIEVKSVSMRMLAGRIAHLRITSFTQDTNEELIEALRRVDRLGGRGIVLDVRNNPGGLLNSVVNVTSHFIKDGSVLTEIDGRGGRKEWPVRLGGLATDIPLVLLVNEFSASGSEVLAGALIDFNRAPVVGVKTFGKGSVNTLRQLNDGSGLYFTTARWYTPGGTLIEGDGLEPDLVVTQPEDGSEDLQLDKAIEILEAKVSAREKENG